jgi:threonine/homoserine/homoserine lactone efflux protein
LSACAIADSVGLSRHFMNLHPGPLILSVPLFSLAGGITPGPNNIMLLSSGVNFGLRASVPHIIGILIGVLGLQLAIGCGFYGLLKALPWLYWALHFAALGYILYLAWRIATADGLSPSGSATRPLTVLQGAAFQWVNPKAWAIGVAVITTFSSARNPLSDAVLVAVVCSAFTLPSLLIWTLFGRMMRNVLASPRTVRFFNVTMAILLVLSLLPALLR